MFLLIIDSLRSISSITDASVCRWKSNSSCDNSSLIFWSALMKSWYCLSILLSRSRYSLRPFSEDIWMSFIKSSLLSGVSSIIVSKVVVVTIITLSLGTSEEKRRWKNDFFSAFLTMVSCFEMGIILIFFSGAL